MLPKTCILAVVLTTSLALSSAVLAGRGAQQTVLPIREVTAAAVAAPRGIVRVSVASDGTQSNGLSTNSVITADGRYVAFESTATNLGPNDTNGRRDVFVHDRSTGITTRRSRVERSVVHHRRLVSDAGRARRTSRGRCSAHR